MSLYVWNIYTNMTETLGGQACRGASVQEEGGRHRTPGGYAGRALLGGRLLLKTSEHWSLTSGKSQNRCLLYYK